MLRAWNNRHAVRLGGVFGKVGGQRRFQAEIFSWHISPVSGVTIDVNDEDARTTTVTASCG